MSRETKIQEIIESAHRLHKPVDSSVMQKVGLSPAQSGMLFMLHHRKGATMKELAAYINVSRSAITQLMEPLVEKGLVSRSPNPSDKRVATLSITSKGKDKLKQLRHYKIEYLRLALGVLNDKELSALQSIYEKMALNINQTKN